MVPPRKGSFINATPETMEGIKPGLSASKKRSAAAADLEAFSDFVSSATAPIVKRTKSDADIGKGKGKAPAIDWDVEDDDETEAEEDDDDFDEDDEDEFEPPAAVVTKKASTRSSSTSKAKPKATLSKNTRAPKKYHIQVKEDVLYPGFLPKTAAEAKILKDAGLDINNILKCNFIPNKVIRRFNSCSTSAKAGIMTSLARNHFNVFEYEVPFKATSKEGGSRYLRILWDFNTGFVHTAPIFSVAWGGKSIPAECISKTPGLNELCQSTTGGDVNYQGYWMPWPAAREIATKFCWKIRNQLIPVFGFDFPGDCIENPTLDTKLMALSPTTMALARECMAAARSRWTATLITQPLLADGAETRVEPNTEKEDPIKYFQKLPAELLNAPTVKKTVPLTHIFGVKKVSSKSKAPPKPEASSSSEPKTEIRTLSAHTDFVWFGYTTSTEFKGACLPSLDAVDDGYMAIDGQTAPSSSTSRSRPKATKPAQAEPEVELSDRGRPMRAARKPLQSTEIENINKNSSTTDSQKNKQNSFRARAATIKTSEASPNRAEKQAAPKPSKSTTTIETAQASKKSTTTTKSKSSKNTMVGQNSPASAPLRQQPKSWQKNKKPTGKERRATRRAGTPPSPGEGSSTGFSPQPEQSLLTVPRAPVESFFTNDELQRMEYLKQTGVISGHHDPDMNGKSCSEKEVEVAKILVGMGRGFGQDFVQRALQQAIQQANLQAELQRQETLRQELARQEQQRRQEMEWAAEMERRERQEQLRMEHVRSWAEWQAEHEYDQEAQYGQAQAREGYEGAQYEYGQPQSGYGQGQYGQAQTQNEYAQNEYAQNEYEGSEENLAVLLAQ